MESTMLHNYSSMVAENGQIKSIMPVFTSLARSNLPITCMKSCILAFQCHFVFYLFWLGAVCNINYRCLDAQWSISFEI